MIFAVSALFHDLALFFCMSSAGKVNLSLTALVVFESRRFRKNRFDFSNRTFPIETWIINLFRYIWRIWFIDENTWLQWPMNVLKYNDVIKKSSDHDYHFGIFWKFLCNTTLMQGFIAMALLIQDLWRSLFLPPTPREYLK